MTIEIVNPLDFHGWDELILTHPDATLFHSAQWAKVLQCSYYFKPLYFLVRKKSKLMALIPLMEIDSYLTGKRGVSLPFTDFCFPLIANNVDVAPIWASVQEYGKQAGWKFFEIRGNIGNTDNTQCFSSYYEHVLDISRGVKYIYDQVRGSHNRNIKKAQNQGVDVTMGGSLEEVKEFYQLHLMTRKKHGLPPPPFKFFKLLQEYVMANGNGTLFIARYNGRAIAGALCLNFGMKAIYKYAASDPRNQYLMPNHLIVWKAIEWYCQRHYNSFSFGRTDIDHKGLAWFKSGWGAKRQTAHYYRYSFINEVFFEKKIHLEKLYNQIFNKLPVPLLNMIGSFLYRHVG